MKLPTSTSVVIATVSWVFTSWRESQGRYLENHRLKVNSRLEKLYGPLHGNRMIYKANLQSIQNKYIKRTKISFPTNVDSNNSDYLDALRQYINQVCEDKDEVALEDWRGFYRRNLQPLDKEAIKIIQKYCHLICTDESKAIMREYIEELSTRSLNIEEWISGDKFEQRGKFDETDFLPGNNNINFEKSSKLEEHVEKLYDSLLEERRSLDSQLQEHQRSAISWDTFLKNLGKK